VQRISPRVSAALAYLVLAAATTFALWSMHQTIDQVEELRQARVEDQQRVEVLLCGRQNLLFNVLREDAEGRLAQIRRVLRDETAPGVDRRELEESMARLEAFINQLQPLDCQELPNQRPFEGRG
jgi:hypothetical protein